jgi:hypothetical protein
MYYALRPMLAVSNGALWLMSTPRGTRGFFYEEWTNGGPEWSSSTVPFKPIKSPPRGLRQIAASTGR